MPESDDLPQPADTSLPTNLGSLNPEELLARGMQSVKMSSAGAHGWEPPTVEEVARLIPTYEVLAMLGRGGMGAVFKARQIALDRLVAIKLLPLEISVSQDFVDRFRREARAMAKLNHPNIIAVHEFGQTGEGHLFFVMEFVEGANLHDIIREVGLDPEQALSLAGQVCTALAYAHGKGVVHRDIKPANVMVDAESHVKVADFGLARLIEPTAETFSTTTTGLVMGTPDYMAPEQKRGMNVDHRADIYSLGVMLYEMLCRQIPEGIFARPSQRIGCDERIDDIVIRAMQQQPELRYQSTAEMKADVETARRPPLPPDLPLAAVSVPAKSTRLPFGVLAAFLAMMAGGAIIWEKPWSSRARQPAMSLPRSGPTQPDHVLPSLATPALPTSPTPASTPIPHVSLEEAVKRLTAKKDWEDVQIKMLPDGTLSLRMADHKIADLSPLAGLPVSELSTQGNPIVDLKPIHGLPLRLLYLDDGPVADLSPLKELPSLVTLGLSRSRVTDLSPLRDMKLRRLSLYQITQEIDLAPLAGMTTLEDILLPQNPKNLQALRSLPNLKFISYKWNGSNTSGSTNPAAEFWKAHDAQQVAQASASPVAMPPTKEPTKPQSATGKWLAEQEPQWQAAFVREVSAPFEKGTGDLKKQYTAALNTELSTATRSGHLDAAVAYRAELKLLADGGDVPAEDEPASFAGLKAFRSTYRKTFGALDAERLSKAKTVQARYDAILAQNQTLLTQRQRLDEALEVKAKREQLTATWLKPPMLPMERALGTATKERPFVNSLGMKFVPVPTGGGRSVLFSVWQTRLQDFRAFATDHIGNNNWDYKKGREPFVLRRDGWWSVGGAGYSWEKCGFEQTDTHPVTCVSWIDARAFCAWLTKKERLTDGWTYRLPADAEWSAAVGLHEPMTGTPQEKAGQIPGVYPWGTQWPPPTGVGNYAGAEAKTADTPPDFRVIEGYRDDFPRTAPVGVFPPNQYGLYDLGGNVAERCEDLFDGKSDRRVKRGATWGNGPSRDYLSSHRWDDEPEHRGSDVGFRCVLAGPSATRTVDVK